MSAQPNNRLARFQPPANRPALSDFFLELARDARIADLDTFADWLSGECGGKSKVTSNWECRDPMRMAEAGSATNLHAALTAAIAGDDELCGRAMRLLAGAYLKAFDAEIVADASERQSESDAHDREAA